MKTVKCTIQILLGWLIIYSSGVHAQSSQEKRIKTFFTGFEKRDWSIIAGQLSPDFTFTSPNGDDHLSQSQYKAKCWGNVGLFKSIEFQRIVEDGNTAFAMYIIRTTDGKIVHNVEYYTFTDGKISSIEAFFGAGIGFPGHPGNVK